MPRTAGEFSLDYPKLSLAVRERERERGKKRIGRNERRAEGIELRLRHIERSLKINLKSQARSYGPEVYRVPARSIYTYMRPFAILRKSRNPKAGREAAEGRNFSNERTLRVSCALGARVSRNPFRKPRILAKLSAEVNSSDYLACRYYSDVRAIFPRNPGRRFRKLAHPLAYTLLYPPSSFSYRIYCERTSNAKANYSARLRFL